MVIILDVDMLFFENPLSYLECDKCDISLTSSLDRDYDRICTIYLTATSKLMDLTKVRTDLASK